MGRRRAGWWLTAAWDKCCERKIWEKGSRSWRDDVILNFWHRILWSGTIDLTWWISATGSSVKRENSGQNLEASRPNVSLTFMCMDLHLCAQPSGWCSSPHGRNSEVWRSTGCPRRTIKNSLIVASWEDSMWTGLTMRDNALDPAYMFPTNRTEPGSQERAADLESVQPVKQSSSRYRPTGLVGRYLEMRLISNQPIFPESRSSTAPMNVCHLRRCVFDVQVIIFLSIAQLTVCVFQYTHSFNTAMYKMDLHSSTHPWNNVG